MVSPVRVRSCSSVLCILLALIAVSSLHAAYVVEWSAPLVYSLATGYTSNSRVSYDVTGDSIPEVMVMDSTGLKIFSGVTHNLIWTISTGSYWYMSYPTIAQVDGDANRELVLSAYRYTISPFSYYGKFFVYDCVTHAQKYACPEKTGYPSVSVADIDGDDKSEICLISGPGGSRVLEVYGSDALDVETPTPAPELSPIGGAWPNPAGPHVALTIPVPHGTGERVTITDVSGRALRVIPTGGSAAVVWDGCEDGGIPAPAGVYLYRCGSVTGRVQLVR